MEAGADAGIGRRKERRRGRPPGPGTRNAAAQPPSMAAAATFSGEDATIHPPPKLKIRLGGKGGDPGQVVTVCDPAKSVPSVQPMDSVEGKRFRPPKKRLSDTCGGSESFPSAAGSKAGAKSNPPTLEEMWRQSMKFREEVMADFSKSERRKGPSSNDGSNPPDSIYSRSSRGNEEPPGCGLDSKPEFKNKRHKTKTRKDRSQSKDRDGNNRRRPQVASTDLVSIAGGGGLITDLKASETGRKRKRNSSAGSAANDDTLAPSSDKSGAGGGDDGSGGADDGSRAVAGISDDPHKNGVRFVAGAVGTGDEPGTAAPKLIIRFGKKALAAASLSSPASTTDLTNPSMGRTGETHLTNPTPCSRPTGEDVTPPPPLEKVSMELVDSASATNTAASSASAAATESLTTVRLMPIKLKLARGGSGSYFTAQQQQQQQQQQQRQQQAERQNKSDSTPPPSPTPPPTNSTKESCQVR